MSARDPGDRTLIARAAAHSKWARCPNQSDATAPARKAAAERFERQVRDEHPDLDDAEVQRRADHLRKQHYSLMALRSHQARRMKRKAAEIEQQVAEGMQDLDGSDMNTNDR